MNGLKLLPALIVGAAIMILPGSAAASGPHFDPAGNQIIGEGPFSIFSSDFEPRITCNGQNQITGGFDKESSTTGELKLDLQNCNGTLFSTTRTCHTTFSLLSNTIEIPSIRFHTVYTPAGKSQPAVLLTFPTVKILCEKLVPVELTGSLIGTITLPECGKGSKYATLAFSATGNKQNQMQITGSETLFDLQTRTEGSPSWMTAAVTMTMTLAFEVEATLTCI